MIKDSNRASVGPVQPITAVHGSLLAILNQVTLYWHGYGIITTWLPTKIALAALLLLLI